MKCNFRVGVIIIYWCDATSTVSVKRSLNIWAHKYIWAIIVQMIYYVKITHGGRVWIETLFVIRHFIGIVIAEPRLLNSNRVVEPRTTITIFRLPVYIFVFIMGLRCKTIWKLFMCFGKWNNGAVHSCCSKVKKGGGARKIYVLS